MLPDFLFNITALGLGVDIRFLMEAKSFRDVDTLSVSVATEPQGCRTILAA